MCVHEESAVYCSTHVCLTVNKLKEENRKPCLCEDVSVCEVYFLSTGESEDTYTLARLEALFTSSQSIQKLREQICSLVFRFHESNR